MKILYRISDSGYVKTKPYYVTPRNVFLHFLKVFNCHEIYVIADNVSDETYDFLCNNINKNQIIRTNLSNAGAFMFAVNIAINHFEDNDIVYFAEDDYIYKKNAPTIIEEGLTVAEYSSGYDHPDKYINHSDGGPNPFISYGGEATRVVLTKTSHWKYTNSCCMTFATTVKVLKEDIDIYKKYCSSTHPNDFHMFLELIGTKNRKLASPIPSVSTHGETVMLAKFVDWEKEINQS
uniref:Glycosyltransferase 2-like domain-containing protein n=1 Tax=viral metagenome TaxID=1070528 RepID=A0A6C0DR24_9ZZZZ